MYNINEITKNFFEDTIYSADCSEIDIFRNDYDEDTANVLYICDFCENYPEDVLNWVYANDLIEEDNKAPRLAKLICQKVDRDASRWLINKTNPINFIV